MPFRGPQTLRLGLSSAQIHTSPNAHCLTACFRRRSRRLRALAWLKGIMRVASQHGSHCRLGRQGSLVHYLSFTTDDSTLASVLRDDAIILNALTPGSSENQLMHRAIRSHWASAVKQTDVGCSGVCTLDLGSQTAISRPLDVSRSAVLPPVWPQPPASVGW